MIVIRRYLRLLIILSGITLSVSFNGNDIAKFLDYIFRLNNLVRTKHGVPPLSRTNEMDVIASQKGYEIDSNTLDVNDQYGVVYRWEYYNDSTQLDVANAIRIFAIWYEDGNFYDYSSEPNDNSTSDFTQIVWRATTLIGLTFKYNDDNNRYEMLAVYYPRGNIVDMYTFNVHRPTNIRPVNDPAIVGLIYQTEKEKFIDNLLKLHNETRTKHRVEPLRHDAEMDGLADSVLMEKEEIGNEYGTNSYGPWSSGRLKLGDKAAAKEVFLSWCKWGRWYKYHSELPPTETEPFAQIVWQNTQQIGIGIQRIIGGQYDVLVLYKPPGNIPGEYRSNVFEPLSMDQGESSGNN